MYGTTATITKPGRFYRERLYVPYFYDKYLRGEYDFKRGDFVLFELDEEDKKIFPELSRRESVRILITSDAAEEL